MRRSWKGSRSRQIVHAELIGGRLESHLRASTPAPPPLDIHVSGGIFGQGCPYAAKRRRRESCENILVRHPRHPRHLVPFEHPWSPGHCHILVGRPSVDIVDVCLERIILGAPQQIIGSNSQGVGKRGVLSPAAPRFGLLRGDRCYANLRRGHREVRVETYGRRNGRVGFQWYRNDCLAETFHRTSLPQLFALSVLSGNLQWPLCHGYFYSEVQTEPAMTLPPEFGHIKC